MRDTKRLKLSEFKKVMEEKDIPGNFTAVRGAYFIPDIKRIGYYKANEHTPDAMYDADLRELLASRILDVIGMPHAEIIPIYDDENENNGCFSVSILRDNEKFIVSMNEDSTIKTVRDFMEVDIEEISKLPGITPEIAESRKKYVAQYLFASALLSNSDTRRDNCQIIYNKKTGEYRNSEYYDAGLSFISHRYFFDGKSLEKILSELYRDYATEILPLAKQTEQRLTKDTINELMSDSIFNEMFEKEYIAKKLISTVKLITRYNHNLHEYGVAEPATISVEDINEKANKTDISLKDRVTSIIQTLRNRIIRKDIDNTHGSNR